MRVYVAGSFNDYDRINEIADELTKLGFEGIAPMRLRPMDERKDDPKQITKLDLELLEPCQALVRYASGHFSEGSAVEQYVAYMSGKTVILWNPGGHSTSPWARSYSHYQLTGTFQNVVAHLKKIGNSH